MHTLHEGVGEGSGRTVIREACTTCHATEGQGQIRCLEKEKLLSAQFVSKYVSFEIQSNEDICSSRSISAIYRHS